MGVIRSEAAIYELERVVGSGQTATVFRAKRRDSRGHSCQTVALKILRSETAVPWLRREFETLARVNSKHCVRVLGWENLSEGCALVLEWVDGVNLLELGRSCDLSADLITEMFVQTSNGLRDLHSLGLIHGDLSPTNILIDRDGCVRIVDFATPAKEEGVVQGTVAYIPPEVWEGNSPSSAGDLFALEMIAFDLETGFRNLPETAELAKDRAKGFQTKRGMKGVDSDSLQCERLSRIVTDLLASRSHLNIETSKVKSRGNGAKRNFLHFASLISLLIVAATAPVRAKAPRRDVEASATLSIRSHRWLEISINGRLAGYAPINLRNLRSGTHRISWKSSGGPGSAQIVLHPNQHLIASEADFARLDARGNR